MRSRIKRITNWLKKFGPALRAIELGETAWSFWERLPNSVRDWVWRLVLFPVGIAIWSFISQRVGEWQGVATENWGWALLAGALLAAITWALVEASRYRLVSGRVASQTDTQGVKEGTGTSTIVEPVYVPEDHDKPSGVLGPNVREIAVAKEGQKMSPDEQQPPRIHVESHDQKGGITAGIINIRSESPPKIELSDESYEKTNEGYVYEANLTVDTHYALPQLKVSAHAESIKSFDVTPQRSGIHMSGHTGAREGFHFTTLKNAEGLYKVRVVTGKAETVRIDFAS